MDDYRRKALAPRPDWEPSDWMPIPTVTYHRPAQSVRDGDELRQLIKGLFGMVVAGLPELPGPATAVKEFVTMLRLTQDEHEIALTFISPYPEALHLMASGSSIDLGGPEGERIMERISGVEIQHSYAIIEGIFLPVVVSYDPGAKRVHFVNKNHVANPDQFMSPWLCRTTSGFLNFIGAQQIAIELRKSKNIVVSDLEAVMNQGLDEWFRWLYYAMETGMMLETDRLLVNKADPEQYAYQYSGE